MNLTICVKCGHPSNEHTADGCGDLIDLGDVCGCQRTETEVYRQHVPPVGEPATEAQGGEDA